MQETYTSGKSSPFGEDRVHGQGPLSDSTAARLNYCVQKSHAKQDPCLSGTAPPKSFNAQSHSDDPQPQSPTHWHMTLAAHPSLNECTRLLCVGFPRCVQYAHLRALTPSTYPASMSKPPLLQASQSSPRPTSTGSYFTDSAINIDISTPPPAQSLPPLDALYTTSSGSFERLTQLAAAAWDAEQDGRLHESNVETLHKQLDNVESCIAGTETEIPEGQQTPRKAQPEAPAPIQSSSNDAHLESLSSDILSDLTSTVSSLRLRHTEYRHLIQLSTSRLEAVAQRCIAQERAIRDLHSELQNLRNENNVLGKENEDSQVEIQQLKAEVASRTSLWKLWPAL